MQHATTMAGMADVCLIRKCARDRGCTGPLVASKPTESCFRLPADGVLQPEETLVPVCMLTCTDDELAAIEANA
jgi:hypothetical protein